MVNFADDLTSTELKSLLHYDPDTGIFTWIVNVSNFVRVGSIAGYINPDRYLVISVNNTRYMAHRLAHLYMTGEWPVSFIDHENRIRDDNRWINIRNASKLQNSRNATVKSNNKSGMKGIRQRWNRWESRIKVNGKAVSLGSFATPEEAHSAYLKAASFYFGEFATSGA